MYALSPCVGPVESFFNFIHIPLSVLCGVKKVHSSTIYYDKFFFTLNKKHKPFMDSCQSPHISP